jgi:hypothetical protein
VSEYQKVHDKLDSTTMEAAAERVLAGTGTVEDEKRVARWTKQMLAWLRARAAEAQR